MKKSNNSISNWLNKHGDPEIRKQVEEEVIELSKQFLDCPYNFTSRCTMGRCDCKPKN